MPQGFGAGECVVRRECFKSEKRSGGGGVYAALRSKNWKKKGCFKLSLKSRRETGESQALGTVALQLKAFCITET